ncbi:MAG: ECF-type sigma factor [Gemmataceae bacterium]
MASDPPVTRWLNQLKQGDRAAVDGLWKEFYSKLVSLAENKLRGVPDHLGMSEEVAGSAFKSFVLAAEKQRFPKLEDRDDLWQILVRIVRNKAATAWEHMTRHKRDRRRALAPWKADGKRRRGWDWIGGRCGVG